MKLKIVFFLFFVFVFFLTPIRACVRGVCVVWMPESPPQSETANFTRLFSELRLNPDKAKTLGEEAKPRCRLYFVYWPGSQARLKINFFLLSPKNLIGGI